MKAQHFKQIVSSNGEITLSGLPIDKQVEVIVIYSEADDLQVEFKRWFKEVQQDHPFSQMSEEEILIELRKTRELVWAEKHADYA